MEIMRSALKHGLSIDDILHAWENALRFIEYEHGSEEKLLVIGPDKAGQLLELVAVPTKEPDRIIHADRLREKYYPFLR